MSKVDEIYYLKSKQQKLVAGVDNIKKSLTVMNTEELNNLRKSNIELKKKLEHLERYSKNFNIRILGISEEEGEDCMAIIMDYITHLGFERECSLYRKKTRRKATIHRRQAHYKMNIHGFCILIENKCHKVRCMFPSWF